MLSLLPCDRNAENEKRGRYMAKNSDYYMSIRVDGQLKQNFDNFCRNCGMTVSGAISLLINQTIEKQAIPFDVTESYIPKGMYEGGELQEKRIAVRVNDTSKKQFSLVCGKIGIPMGRLVKMFMLNCLHEGKLPF
jgi:addiction module RelB/DinJ family antitoxin